MLPPPAAASGLQSVASVEVAVAVDFAGRSLLSASGGGLWLAW